MRKFSQREVGTIWRDRQFDKNCRKLSKRRCESAADHIERPQARDKAPARESQQNGKSAGNRPKASSNEDCAF